MNLLNKLTTKNLKLNKKRTVVSIIGIMLSIALITAVASMVVSFRKSYILCFIHRNRQRNFNIIKSSSIK